MASGKAKPQLRVLLAGHSSNDLRGAQQYLQSQGSEATVCLSHEQARKALTSGNFDVAVVEVRSNKSTRRKAQEVDGLKLLALENVRTPVAVATTVCNERSMVEAVELGAVDILRTPIASQQDRLATLWQHAVRKGKEQPRTVIKTEGLGNAELFPHAADAISEADGGIGIGDLCSEGLLDGNSGPEDFLDGFLPGLFSPEHVGDIDWCLEEERQASIPTPDTPDHLSYDRGMVVRADSVRDRISGFSAVPSDGSVDPSCLHAVSCASALVPSLESQPTMVPTGSMQCMSSGVRDSDTLSTFESDCTEAERASKKQKVEWTDDLHDRFVTAVESLGADSAVPSKILDLMGPVAAGLTRQNIASHLQKYRNSIKLSPGLSRKRSRAGSLGSCRGQTTGSALPPLLPAPAAGNNYVNSMSYWPGVPSSSYGQYGSWPNNSMPFMPVSIPPAWCATNQATLTAPREQVSSAIQEVLGKPQSIGPLGLRLDASSLLTQLHQAMPAAVKFE